MAFENRTTSRCVRTARNDTAARLPPNTCAHRPNAPQADFLLHSMHRVSTCRHSPPRRTPDGWWRRAARCRRASGTAGTPGWRGAGASEPSRHNRAARRRPSMRAIHVSIGDTRVIRNVCLRSRRGALRNVSTPSTRGQIENRCDPAFSRPAWWRSLRRRRAAMPRTSSNRSVAGAAHGPAPRARIPRRACARARAPRASTPRAIALRR